MPETRRFLQPVDFNDAVTKGGVAIPTISSTSTLTNKTLTAPVLSGSVTGTYTLAGTPTISGGLTTPKVTEYDADGAIAVESHVAVITKTGVGAMTLAAPTAEQAGTTITITSSTSNAHVITGTNLFWAGETGGPFNLITLAAFPGSSATVVAHNLLWLVVSDQTATVSDS